MYGYQVDAFVQSIKRAAAPAIKAGSQTYVSFFARFANTRKVVRQLTIQIGHMTCETRDSDRSPKPLAH
eukprot:scaffold45556_cov358-Skeletonema_marinoi.AAC.1